MKTIGKAERQLGIAGDGHIWWIFFYVGDRPERFSGWWGIGCVRDGGRAIVNYDTIPGEIRPDLGLEEGFNSAYFLKATVHELGHALGLPHIGPDPSLGRGNSLMGANTDVYIERKQPHPDRVYLTEASAAMLWKHPVFSGTTKDRQRQPSVKMVNYKPTYSRASDRITLAGRLVSDIGVHSVVVLDDLGRPDDEYWCRSHVGRIAPDGTFRVAIDHPARADGHFRIVFCFDNGMVTGDGAGVVFGDRGRDPEELPLPQRELPLRGLRVAASVRWVGPGFSSEGIGDPEHQVVERAASDSVVEPPIGGHDPAASASPAPCKG